MSIVFFGSTDLGFACCSAIIEAGIKVDAIFTIPERFTIKYKNESQPKHVSNVLFKDFSFFKGKYGIPVHPVENNITDFKSYLVDLNPDLIVVIGWYFMIPESIRTIPKLGCVAIHASLLPKYRGNAPLVWAMINGEKQTGISLLYLEGGIDEGDIVAQQAFTIAADDTILEVLEKAKNASVEIVKEHIPKILDGSAKRKVQNHSDATYFPKRSPEDGEIDWNWDVDKINRFIRAQTHPYPGAFTIIEGKKVILWKADIQNLK
jgi:methionyl-tRNA formyltransferase